MASPTKEFCALKRFKLLTSAAEGGKGWISYNPCCSLSQIIACVTASRGWSAKKDQQQEQSPLASLSGFTAAPQLPRRRRTRIIQAQLALLFEKRQKKKKEETSNVADEAGRFQIASVSVLSNFPALILPMFYPILLPCNNI